MTEGDIAIDNNFEAILSDLEARNAKPPRI
jgi:hypothetical protein